MMHVCVCVCACECVYVCVYERVRVHAYACAMFARVTPHLAAQCNALSSLFHTRQMLVVGVCWWLGFRAWDWGCGVVVVV